ncbi:MAG: hypothetical protein GY855_01440 [candidate division Zixibacteria bacterium]|nr:hypothetical protein [candidate division Zixibacteria bacterium]
MTNISKVTLLIFILFSLSNLSAANESTKIDTLKFYSELCGDYEFYFKEKYNPIKIYIEREILKGRQKGRDPIVLSPVNLGGLTFTAFNGSEYFKITFTKNDEGKIIRFILSGEQGEDIAERVFAKSKVDQFGIEVLQEDFKQFRRLLEENHCCLYEYTSKGAFDKLFERQYGLINRPMQWNEFYKILTPLIAKVGCGHTAVWMPDGYWDMGIDKMFPLRIRLIEDYVVVAGSYKDSVGIPVGSIILSINDRPIDDIIKEMKANYSADAFNQNFISSQIERRFSLIFARRFGFHDKYNIIYALPDRKTRETAELLPANISYVRSAVFTNFSHPELTIELIEEKSTAIMTINTFIYYDRVDYFKGYLDSCFNAIHEKKIKNLILDLRGNDGGDPFCAAPLFSYLFSKPVPYYAEPYGKYSKLAEPIPLAEKHFTGNLYTLIDGRCFSTNGHFCSLLDYHNIGKFIGTESGATYKCNAGKDTEAHLKNTRIMLYFGRSTFAAAVKGMDKTKPIMPDYPVKVTYQDFLDGKDVFMETALKLIDKTD